MLGALLFWLAKWSATCVALVLLAVLLLYLLDRRSFVPFVPAAKPSRKLGNRRWKGDGKDLLLDDDDDSGGGPGHPDDVVDCVVIGSGQGGLSCAATLSQFGERVVVCEQHEVTGGGAHSYAVEGKSKWCFDAGLHITVPPHQQALQVACGAQRPPVVFDMLHDERGASDYIGIADDSAEPLPVVAGPGPIWSSGRLNIEKELATRFPSQEEALRRYFSIADAVQLRFGLLLFSAMFPSWVRCLFLQSPIMTLWRNWAGKTAAEGLTELVPGDDVEARKLRSYMVGLWLDTGAPPSRGSFFMQTAVFGGWQKLGEAYPRGGPQRTALSLVEAIEARRGRVFVRCPVKSVLLDGGRACGVRLSNGDLIRAKRVVSAIGYRATEALLASSDNPPVPPPMPLKTKQSAGFVMANIALNGTARDLGIDDSTLWLQPADEANGFDALAGERAFFADPLGVPLTQIPAGITFPSVKGRDGYVPDRDVPQSECVHHSCQILVPAEWKWFEEYVPAKGDDDESSRHAPPHVARRKQEEYDRIKERWSVRLLALFHQHYPKTIGRVEFCDVSTPATLAYYLRAVHGAGVGLDVTPGRFVDPEELREVDPRHPRVEGLWRAGQDHLMCGQVMAAASGIITALRMRGTWDTTKFGVRTLRLLLESSDGDASISRSTKEKRS